MKMLQKKLLSLYLTGIANISKEKKIVALLLATSTASNGQGFDEVGGKMWDQAESVYQLMSVFVLLAGLFFLGKGIIEGLRGEQGAWVKIGGSLLVFGVWFFAVPPLIRYLASQASSTNNFGDI